MLLRPDAGIAVDGSEPYADVATGLGVVAVQSGPAVGAEALREAAVAGVPALDELLALRDAKRAFRGARVGRRTRARSPLATRAVAVVGRHERLGHLVSHAS